MNFLEAIYALKRKAQLTGNPLTNQNVNALTSGYIESATDMMNNERAVDLQEEALAQTTAQNAASLAEAKRQAEESSSQAAIESANEIAAAEKASKNTLTGNLMNTGTSLVGTALMTEGGRAAIKGAITGAGKLVSNALSSSAPTTAQATLTGAAAPAGAAATQTGGQLAAQAALTEGDFIAATSVPVEAGASALGILSTAAPYVAAGKIGMPILGNLMGTGFRDAFGIDPDSSNVMAQLNRTVGRGAEGVITPLLEETGIVKKVPEVVTALTNPAGWLLSKCIIVTACTDPHSPEVEIAREYRDKFMSPDQLRGYYMIAEAVMPWVVRHRAFVKKAFVNRLVEYGSYHLGKTEKRPSRAACAVACGFLSLCRLVGKHRESFIRCNGEVF